MAWRAKANLAWPKFFQPARSARDRNSQKEKARVGIRTLPANPRWRPASRPSGEGSDKLSEHRKKNFTTEAERLIVAARFQIPSPCVAPISPTNMNNSVRRLISSLRPVLALIAPFLSAAFSLTSAHADGLAPDKNFLPPSFVKPIPAEHVLLLPDGKFLLFLDPDTLTDQPTGAITRFLADGTLDTSFSFSRTYKAVGAAAPAGNGKIYVAATRYAYGGKDAEQILRLNSDGSIDANFTPATVGGPDTFLDVRQILVQADGKILVAGFFASFSGDTTRKGIVRLLDNGTVDSSFAPVTVDDATLWAVALQTDGKVLIGGIFSSVNGGANPGIARLNPNGSVDSSFQPAGFTRNSTSPIRAIAVQSDGKIVMGGNFRIGAGGNPPRGPLVRLNADGSVDASFNSASTITSLTTARDHALQSDGKIVVILPHLEHPFRFSSSPTDGLWSAVYFPMSMRPAL